jgi:hypothetical protein
MSSYEGNPLIEDRWGRKAYRVEVFTSYFLCIKSTEFILLQQEEFFEIFNFLDDIFNGVRLLILSLVVKCIP